MSYKYTRAAPPTLEMSYIKTGAAAPTLEMSYKSLGQRPLRSR
jgi:hypothetical protein